MRLVVHLGAAQAASRRVQRALARNEDALRERGVYLPKAGRLDVPEAGIAHHNLGWQLLGDPSYRPARGGWPELIAELADVDADTVLLSSESFGRLASDPAKRTLLAGRLAEVTDDVVLVYVVAEPLEQINAMFLQVVRAFGKPASFEEFASASVQMGYYNLEDSFRFWYESDRVSFIALPGDEISAECPLESLLSAVGIAVQPGALVAPDELDAQAPGPIAVEAMRLANAHLRIVDAQFSRRSPAANRIALIAERRGLKFGWYDDEYWGWNQKQAEWAVGRFEPANQSFARAVWGTDWPIVSPVSRPQSTMNLIFADGKVHREVGSVMTLLTTKYLKFVAGRVLRPTVPGASDEVIEEPEEDAVQSPIDGVEVGAEVGDDPSEDDARDRAEQVSDDAVDASAEDVVDATTIFTDEAERAGIFPGRRPSTWPPGLGLGAPH